MGRNVRRVLPSGKGIFLIVRSCQRLIYQAGLLRLDYPRKLCWRGLRRGLTTFQSQLVKSKRTLFTAFIMDGEVPQTPGLMEALTNLY